MFDRTVRDLLWQIARAIWARMVDGRRDPGQILLSELLDDNSMHRLRRRAALERARRAKKRSSG